MIELKPCPFCGSDDVSSRFSVANIHAVFCEACGAVVSFVDAEDEDGAIAAWNTRTAEEKVPYPYGWLAVEFINKPK